jgi:tetratricopeptide (TPR) repeat protein
MAFSTDVRTEEEEPVTYLWRLALVTALVLGVIGCGGPKKESKKALDMGRIYLQRDNLSQAATQFRLAIAKDTGNVEAQKLLIDTLMRMNNHADAIAQCKAFLEKKPDDKKGNQMLGKALLAAAEAEKAKSPERHEQYLREAEALAESLTGTDPASGHYLRARLAITRRDVQDATLHLEEAIKRDPTLSDARLDLARVYIATSYRKRAEERDRYRRRAIEQYEKVAQTDKERAFVARHGLATVALQAGDLGRAESEVQEIRKVRPDDIDALQLLADVRLRQNKPDEVLKLVTQIRKINPKAFTAGLAGIAYLRKDNLERAEQQLTRAVRGQPGNPRYRVTLGYVLEKLGRPQQAVTHYEAAVKAAPFFLAARVALAQLHVTEGDYERARQQLQAAIEAEPTDPQGIAALTAEERQTFREAKRLYMYTEYMKSGKDIDEVGRRIKTMAGKSHQSSFWVTQQAQLALQNKEPEKAIQILSAAVKESPANLSLRATYGRFLIVTGRMEEGMKEFARAERMAPKSQLINRERAQAFLRINRADLALVELKKGLAKAPNSVPMKRVLAGLYLRLGRTRDAIDIFASLHEADPANTRNALSLAGAYAAGGRLDDAEKLARKVLAESKESIRARTVLVSIYKKRGKVAEATEQMTKMIEANPKHPPGYELAILRIAEGRNKDAVALIEKLFAANKDTASQPTHLVRMAVAQAGLGDTIKAANALEGLKSLATAATDEDTRQGLRRLHAVQAVAVHAALGRNDAAAEALRDARRMKVPEGALEQLSRLLRDCRAHSDKAPKIAHTYSALLLLHDAGWKKQALEQAGAMKALLPDSDQGVLMLGNLQLQYGRLPEAEKTFRALVAKKPSAHAYTILGDIAQRHGKAAEAKDLFGKALKANPESETAYLRLGLMAESAGDSATAVRIYKDCVASVPKSVAAYNQLAWIYGQHEKGRQRAIQYARKARELDPESPSVADTLGWVCHLNGDTDNALKYLEEASQKLARNATVWYHLGTAQAKKGLTEKAASSYRTSLALNPRQENAKAMREFLKKNQ